MTHFEAYHWEDHVPRAGSWKFNLAAGLLALGLIATALPDSPERREAMQLAARKPAAEAAVPTLNMTRGMVPVAFRSSLGKPLACPHETADS